MKKEYIEDLVEKLVLEIIQDDTIELVDVEFVKERDWYLRVFLDKAGGIDVEDCQKVSEQLEARLDQIDPIKDSYYLEVSSPGLGRVLKKERDFIRHAGEKVEVHLFAPWNQKKEYIGFLQERTKEGVSLLIEGQPLLIPQEKIAHVKLYIEF